MYIYYVCMYTLVTTNFIWHHHYRYISYHRKGEQKASSAVPGGVDGVWEATRRAGRGESDLGFWDFI